MQHRPKIVTKAREDVESLYHDLLRKFYEDADLAGAARVAKRLEQQLVSETEAARSIRGDEIRSLLAELRGDWDEAIRNREREIRRILALHTIQEHATREYICDQYSYSDIADRLDLLANLFARRGDLDCAIETLIESREFCELHHIPFDGQELLDEFEQDRREREKANH
jgi:hypothetical protein